LDERFVSSERNHLFAHSPDLAKAKPFNDEALLQLARGPVAG
jgi:hypothetical protein